MKLIRQRQLANSVTVILATFSAPTQRLFPPMLRKYSSVTNETLQGYMELKRGMTTRSAFLKKRRCSLCSDEVEQIRNVRGESFLGSHQSQKPEHKRQIR
eukprot:scpid40567/ scgid27522/ 